MNYAALAQEIQDFAVDAETTFLSHIPDFVLAAEQRIYNDADLPVAEMAAAPTITSGSSSVTMPAGFRSVDSFALTANSEVYYLLPKSVDFLQTAYPTAATNTGVPKYYAVANSTTLFLGPTPDAAYVSQLRYFGYPTSIVIAGTSWLGDNYPYALLYGALRDAAAFLKEEADIVAMYDARYAEAVGQIKAFGAQKSRLDRYRKRG